MQALKEALAGMSRTFLADVHGELQQEVSRRQQQRQQQKQQNAMVVLGYRSYLLRV